MKSVGIITFHNAHNCGAILQTYALQETLKNMQYNVNIINYNDKKITRNYKLIKYSRKNPIKTIKLLYESIKFYKINKQRYDAFNDFIAKNLKLTKLYKSVNSLKKDYPKFDYYITGSDQVWNVNLIGKKAIDAYTLNFGTNDIKKISYAASIGKASIDEKYKKQYKNNISKLDYISVREETAKKVLEKMIDKPIEVVLDPTLLLTRNEWDSKLAEYKKYNEKYILTYLVEENEECKKIVKYIAEKTGMKVIHFKREKIYKEELDNGYTSNPLEFVNMIRQAEYVVTNSFHATVFSIIYNKKFFTIPHSKASSRMTDLLKKLNIEDRIFYNLDEFKKIDYETLEIDYENVVKIINNQRINSIEFLKKSLMNGKGN